jgi:hypothetical protein
MVLKMKMTTINKHSKKLKVWSVEMPNASYTNVVGKQEISQQSLKRKE